jgi:single-strand DNA-binding protein
MAIGRLGKDPETRKTTTGKSVTNFTLATDSGYGEKKTTQWHNVVAWDKTADLVQNYLKKGSKVFLEGEVTYGSYEKNGQTVYKTEIVARSVEFLDSKTSRDTTAPKQDDLDIPF